MTKGSGGKKKSGKGPAPGKGGGFNPGFPGKAGKLPGGGKGGPPKGQIKIRRGVG